MIYSTLGKITQPVNIDFMFYIMHKILRLLCRNLFRYGNYFPKMNRRGSILFEFQCNFLGFAPIKTQLLAMLYGSICR